ncbi:MAG TPA: nascent polypeptide-associated complex protein [archaeon]|nr:nascent polypeptide-associated complex protein [archaeon]
MLPGLGGMNPSQMKNLMRQMGIKTEDLKAKRVVFELEDGNLVIEDPQITAMQIQGKMTYTVMGEAKKEKSESSIPQSDIDLVAAQSKVSKEKARKALEESEGDIAKAIAKLGE